jgi:4,5:9,10-diseco-3-hydroxy-5,9,17-trioxoandrosta-1(10),2-diene-4-oate hydrolase
LRRHRENGIIILDDEQIGKDTIKTHMKLPQDNYIKAGSINTRYWVLGEGKSNVILIHGLGASADIWMHNIRALSDNHRIYVPDLMGFGRSDIPGGSFAPTDYVQFINDFLKALKIEHTALVGQSLGGGIALLYTIRFPEKVKRLVLVDNAGFGYETIWTLRGMSLPVIGKLMSIPSRMGVKIFFQLAVRNPAVITDELIDIYYEHFTRPGQQAFVLRLIRSIIGIRGIKREILAPVLENIQKVTQPTLIIWGERDRVLPLTHAYYGKEKIQGAELRIFSDCGHIPFFEQPDAFNCVVRDFLRRTL